jgi:hypothetical protein
VSEGGCNLLCSNPVEIKSPITGEKTIRKTSSILVPCNQCLNCRITKAYMWTCRILLESLSHALSSFVTLTYNEDFLPPRASLKSDDLKNFFKRLRSNAEYQDFKTAERCGYPRFKKYRYYACGEYGRKDERPHYHIALFGHGHQEGKGEIERAWSKDGNPMGIVHVGELNNFSARYIAGYVCKKLGYDVQNKRMESIELRGREKQFHRMSKNPPLGTEAIKKLGSKAGDKKFSKVVQNGKEITIDRTLRKKLMRIQGYGQDYELLSKYTNELFDLKEAGMTFREGVLTAMQGRRNRKQKLYHMYKKGDKI